MRQDYQNAALQGKGSGSGKFVHNKRKMFEKNFKWTYQMDQVFLKMRCSRIKRLQMDRWKQQRNLTRHWKAFSIYGCCWKVNWDGLTLLATAPSGVQTQETPLHYTFIQFFSFLTHSAEIFLRTITESRF